MELVTLVGAVVGPIVALVTLVLGLTAEARLRRKEQMFREVLTASESGPQNEVLKSVHRQVVAMLVARHLVPRRYLWAPMFGWAGVAALWGYAGWERVRYALAVDSPTFVGYLSQILPDAAPIGVALALGSLVVPMRSALAIWNARSWQSEMAAAFCEGRVPLMRYMPYGQQELLEVWPDWEPRPGWGFYIRHIVLIPGGTAVTGFFAGHSAAVVFAGDSFSAADRIDVIGWLLLIGPAGMMVLFLSTVGLWLDSPSSRLSEYHPKRHSIRTAKEWREDPSVGPRWEAQGRSCSHGRESMWGPSAAWRMRLAACFDANQPSRRNGGALSDTGSHACAPTSATRLSAGWDSSFLPRLELSLQSSMARRQGGGGTGVLDRLRKT